MPRLPPVEKLPLALRKNIRDDWDAKKPDLEKKLSATLETAWTIDVNPNALYAYASSDYAKQALGSLIGDYIRGALMRLEEFKNRQGAEGVRELNTVAAAHVLTMDLDEAGASPSGSAAVVDGRLVLLFQESSFGTNVEEAFALEKLTKALNEAPAGDAGDAATPALSFTARQSIRKDYEDKIGSTQAAVAALLDNAQITLVPNFESVYAALLAESKRAGTALDGGWEGNLGSFVFLYLDGVCRSLESQGFGTDDMLREGFNEAVEKNTIAFRFVEKLQKALYCETVLEDGTLYVQTVVGRWGSNISDAGSNIVDLL